MRLPTAGAEFCGRVVHTRRVCGSVNALYNFRARRSCLWACVAQVCSLDSENHGRVPARSDCGPLG